VAAVLVPKNNSHLEVKSLKSWCKDNAAMAPYAVPTVWKVIESMPRNAMGKVNKKELVDKVFSSSN
jgi:malonyl-CoA/methylmalonyl-CoA synthetase